MGIDKILLDKAFEQLKRKYSKFSEIELGEKIGEGAFSSVYDVKGYRNDIVLKVTDTFSCRSELTPEVKYGYARQEIEILKYCQDSNYIMPMLGDTEYIVNEEDKHSLFLLVMPKLKSLYSVVSKMNLFDTLQMMKDICKALMICHKRHFLHRDVSMGNVFVQELDDGSKRYILGDFGIARYGIEKRYNKNGWFVPVTKMGSYLAPEIIIGKTLTSYNSDIFSLGIMCESMIDCSKLIRGNITRSEEMMRIVRKAGDEKPENRYLTADDLLKDLEQVDLSGEGKNKANAIIAYKTAILVGKRAYAEGCLRREFLRGELSGIKLYAYLLYGNYRKALKSYNEVKAMYESGDYGVTAMDVGDELASKDFALAKLEDALSKLAEISYMEDDAIASGLLAFIRLDMCDINDGKSRKKWFNNLKESAEDGCVFAQYYCGRWLIDGNMKYIDKNFDEGVKLLNMALANRYIPAYIYMKRYLSTNPDNNMLKEDPETIKVLEMEIELEDVPVEINKKAMIEVL